jgi:hypothetical protein
MRVFLTGIRDFIRCIVGVPIFLIGLSIAWLGMFIFSGYEAAVEWWNEL